MKNHTPSFSGTLQSRIVISVAFLALSLAMVIGFNFQPLTSHALASSKPSPQNIERRKDIHAIQKQINKFAVQNGYYPSLHDINDASWRAVNLKKLKTADLADPSNPADTQLVGAPDAKHYAYVVTDSHDSSCEADDTTCAIYTLTAVYQGEVHGATTFTVTGNL